MVSPPARAPIRSPARQKAPARAGSISIEPKELADRLAGYGQLLAAEASWRSQYGEFPRVLVIFASHKRASRERMEMRVSTVAVLARDEEEVMAGDLRVYFTLLEYLQEKGPLTPIWAPLAAPERLVGWLDDEPAGLRVVWAMTYTRPCGSA